MIRVFIYLTAGDREMAAWRFHVAAQLPRTKLLYSPLQGIQPCLSFSFAEVAKPVGIGYIFTPGLESVPALSSGEIDRMDSCSPASSSATAPEPEAHPPGALPRHTIVQIGIIGLLFLFLNRRLLLLMAYMAKEDPNWSHAFLVPLISLWLIYQRREPLLRASPRTCCWGVPVLLLAVLGCAAGVYLQSAMMIGYAMVFELAGLILFLAGPTILRVVWLPVAYLAFGVKITLFWDPFALLLQKWAAGLASLTVSLVGVPFRIEADAAGSLLQIYRNGIQQMPPLNVDAACSGLRMLMALIALAVAVAWLQERVWWKRLGFILAAVPVALAVNVLRLTLTGLLYPFAPDWCTGVPHEILGLLMLVPALLAYAGLDWILDKGETA